MAARTSGYSLPMVVEATAEFAFKDDTGPDEVRAFLEELVDFNGGSYFVSRCGVYPEQRFVRHFEIESVNKLKDPAYLSEVAQSEFNVDLAANVVSVLDARNGADIDVEDRQLKQVVFCGGPIAGLQQQQDQLLAYGVYPDRMELSTVTTLGGICDYARHEQIDSPILCFELTPKSANIFIVTPAKSKWRGRCPLAWTASIRCCSVSWPRDADSARKLLFANTFDFAEMGTKLLQRIIKELQAATDFTKCKPVKRLSTCLWGCCRAIWRGLRILWPIPSGSRCCNHRLRPG